MKHAYLILAHNEFQVLDCLIQAIDNSKNDIYIHFDKKVKELPKIKCKFSNLYILEKRIKVFWGDISIIKAEYLLLEEATRNNSYDYYHILSGVDMPLKSQSEIHAFFNKNKGKEFIGYSQYDYSAELERKAHRYHLFPHYFKSSTSFGGLIRKVIRYVFIRLQYLLKIRRNKNIIFKKGPQWVSITDNFSRFILQKKKEVFKTLGYTYCADEIFIQTLCWHSPYMDNIFDKSSESKGSMRKLGWKNGVLYDWENKDYDKLKQSEYLFARKFNSRNMIVINRILQDIKENENN